MTMKKIQKLGKVIEELATVDPEFPMQWALVFQDIALNEGASLRDISERTGISMSVMSRTIGALSNYRRMGKPYGLVLVKNAKHDRRVKELYLSKKGHKLADKISKIL